MWGPSDGLRSILYSLQSPHLRNLLLSSAALALAGRYLGPHVMWMPRWLRKGTFGSLFSFWFVLVWLLYYYFNVVERPVVFYRRSSWNAMIMERFELPMFRPVFWAFNAHAQSILCNSLNKLDEALKPFASYRRETLPSFDGNEVVLDWAKDESNAGIPPDAPIVFILHGIYGSATDNYCRNIVELCSSRGWRSVVHDRWRIDFAETRDVEVALTTISARYPAAPIFAVGFSAGGHVLLSYLEAMGERVPLVGAVAISPALDLVKMIHHMRRHHNVSYRLAMDGCIRACVRRHLAGDRLLDQESMRPFLSRMGRMGAHQIYDSMLCHLSTFSNHPHDPYEAREWRKTHPIMQAAASAAPSGVAGATLSSAAGTDAAQTDGRLQQAAHDAEEALEAVLPAAGAEYDEAPKVPRPTSPTSEAALVSEWHTEGTTALPPSSEDGFNDPHAVHMHRIASRDTLRPLPEAAYSPFGNPTAPHYMNTAGNNLHKIRVPTLIMTARDDPMMAPSFFNTLERAGLENPNVIFARTNRGGHCAWHTGVYPAGASYAEKMLVDFIAAVVAAQCHTAFIVDVVRRSLASPETEDARPPSTDFAALATSAAQALAADGGSPTPQRRRIPTNTPTPPFGRHAATLAVQSRHETLQASASSGSSDAGGGAAQHATWTPRARQLWTLLQEELGQGNHHPIAAELRPAALARICYSSSTGDMSRLEAAHGKADATALPIPSGADAAERHTVPQK